MLSAEIRRKFLRYFKEQGHAVVTSAPLVPHEDPTLLFNNAGMNQFKDVFLGASQRDYSRAATSQKCIRVGGKHNDLENVGHTTRHLTFFEMLGNFSFGDYFKKEAIQYAWEVTAEIFGFEPEKLWATIYLEDDESFELWKAYLPEERICRFGEKDNFWAMGDTGPCGPCSELYYDRGSAYGEAPTPHEDASGERYVEFWNLVFMEKNRQADGTLVSLPKPSIDTGAGLERVLGLMLGVESVFETDILKGLIDQVQKISSVTYDHTNERIAPAFHVIADHLRCLAFAIADGAQPSNVDRGYVLRKVLRRAVRYGRSLGIERPFLADVLPSLITMMGEDYQELKLAETRIADILTMEEEAFIRTLRRGGNMLSQIITSAKNHDNRISGDEAFKLKDTYGFPVEEILLIAKDATLSVDLDRYQKLEHEAKERSRKVHQSTDQIAEESLFAEHSRTEFLGYNQTSAEAKVTALVVEGELVDTMNQGDSGMVVLDRTPFYAEMGGQVGDKGTLKSERHHFNVTDCQAPFKGVIAHVGKLEEGTLNIGDTLTATIDIKRRKRIANNHTATHILHWALQEILGPHIKQAGSVVDAKRFRFDFSHHKAVSQEEIHEIEDLINQQIRQNGPMHAYELAYDEAQKDPTIKQFFGDKYGRVVRVVDIDFSKELCGGTHTSHLGNIGLVRITKESSIAAGVRRIEAVSGVEAEHFARQGELQIVHLASLAKTQPKKLVDRVKKMLHEIDSLSKELAQSKDKEREKEVKEAIQSLQKVNQTPLLAIELKLPPQELSPFAEAALNHLKTGVIVLACTNQEKCHILAKVSDDLVSKGIHAGELIKAIAPIIDGKGGGKAHHAQAGGTSPEKIGAALAKVPELL